MRTADASGRVRAVATRGEGQAGFTLVMFVVVLAIMSVFMSVAIQAVSFQMRREREEELIFRGTQYVEGIRLYRMRFGRHPMTLKEMWEAKPRVVRKKWKDPITDSDAWGLVFVGQEGRVIQPPDQGRPEGDSTPTPTPTATPEPGGSEEGGPGRSGSPQVGPIAGVYSKSCEDSIKVYEGRNRYCDWKFVMRDQPAPRGGGPPGPTRPPTQPPDDGGGKP